MLPTIVKATFLPRDFKMKTASNTSWTPFPDWIDDLDSGDQCIFSSKCALDGCDSGADDFVYLGFSGHSH